MRPQIGEALAKQLAARYWGFAAQGLSCSPCAGYDDTNLKLQLHDGIACVFKAHNAGDSIPGDQYAEAQNALLLALSAWGFSVPAPLPLKAAPAADGDDRGSCCDSSTGCSSVQPGADAYTLRVAAPSGLHAVRLLTWLPGTLLVDAPQSLELYRQLGALLGRANRALMAQAWDWRPTSVLRRAFDWNLCHLVPTYARVRPHLLSLPALDVPLLDRVVAHFEATVAAEPGLRMALIHSDANERNVLVDARAAAAAAAAAAGQAAVAAADEAVEATGAVAAAAKSNCSIITGLIDWGDASWQWLAAEPANAAVYMMLLEPNISNPLPAAAALLGGYEAECALLPAERRVLRVLCMGRLAMSLSLGAHAASRQPDNQEYLLGTQRNGWRLLGMLWELGDERFLAALPPSPPAPASA